MKNILSLFICLPLYLSAQTKKPINAVGIQSPATYITRAKKQLLEGDTTSACINFMKGKALGFYKLPLFYSDDEENTDDVVTCCYDENLQIKRSIQVHPEFKKLNYPPLEFVSGEVFNDEFGTPVLKFQMHNTSSKSIDAYKCIVRCYNRFNEPVKGIENSNTGIVTYQETIEPGEDGGSIEGYYFTFFQGITKIKVTLIKVHFTDGSTWVPSKGQTFTTMVTSSR